MKINVHEEIPRFYQIKGAAIFLLRHLFKRNTFLKEAQVENAREISDFLKLQNTKKIIQVDRIENLDEKTFVKNYLNKGLPVIFSQEALSWKSTTKWSFEYLASEFGQQEYPIINIKGLSESAQEKNDKKVNLKEYLDSLKVQNTDEYLRFWSLLDANPVLEEDLNQEWLLKMKKCFLGISYQSFLGPRGKRTPLHSDTTAFFYIMNEGQKKWTMFLPSVLAVINPEPEGRGYNFTKWDIKKSNHSEYPGADMVTRFECILEKGDILFVPAWMWHEVENLTESFGISYRFTSLRGFFQFPFYAFLRIFFTNPSFLKIIYYSFFRNDLHKRDKYLLTPKIIIKK